MVTDMKKKVTNLPSCKEIKYLTDKLPEELRTKYENYAHKKSAIIEQLKIAAALKLYNDRGFSDIRFDAPIVFGDKTVFVKVLAKHAEGTVFGVECASEVRLGWLRKRVTALQTRLPRDSYVVAVFPETASEKADEAVNMADEVWITGKKGTINQMMFSSFLGKE
jgi:hypothetical protein